MPKVLSEEQIKHYRENGYLGQMDGIAPTEARAMLADLTAFTETHGISAGQLQMKGQLATLKVSGALASSAEVMKSMNALVRIPETQKVMMELMVL